MNAAKGIGIKESLHTKRLAIDLLLFDDDGTYLTQSENYATMGEAWESLHPACRWGGMADGNHFELRWPWPRGSK